MSSKYCRFASGAQIKSSLMEHTLKENNGKFISQTSGGKFSNQ